MSSEGFPKEKYTPDMIKNLLEDKFAKYKEGNVFAQISMFNAMNLAMDLKRRNGGNKQVETIVKQFIDELFEYESSGIGGPNHNEYHQRSLSLIAWLAENQISRGKTINLANQFLYKVFDVYKQSHEEGNPDQDITERLFDDALEGLERTGLDAPVRFFRGEKEKYKRNSRRYEVKQ